MSPTWKAVIGIVLIFILGWFGGVLTTLVIVHHRINVIAKQDPEPMATLLERQLTHGLRLNDSQRDQLHSLLVENLRSRLQLQRQIQPQVKALNRQTVQQIDTLLSADQQKKFEDNLFLFKRRYGRNPLNTGQDESAPATVGTSATNAAPANPAGQ